MIRSTKKLRAVDLFCGAGGMTLGAERSGNVKVVVAVNHWRTAIFTHEKNHPQTRHICARVEDMNLRDEHNLPELDAVFGGIECVFHSNARGAAPINDQRRTSAWRVIDWIEKFRPRWCVFENVREFLKWGPIDGNGRKIKSKAGEIFNAWIAAIRSHGYHVEWKVLNAAEYGEATRRHRLFIICRRGGSNRPFKWPAPTHGTATDIQNSLAEDHRCNLRYERPAADIIDWSKPCPSIFGRKRPLAEKTLRRIEIGLRKFVAPFVMQFAGPGRNDPRYDGCFDARRPLPTLLAKPTLGVVEPYLVNLKGTSNAADAFRPSPTITAGARHLAVACPFIIQFHSGRNQSRWENRNYSLDEPMRTLDTQPRYSLAVPFLAQTSHTGSTGRGKYVFGARRAMPTVTARHETGVCVPYLMDIHNRRRDDTSHSVADPMPTVVTKPGNSVVMPYLLDVNHGGRDARTYPIHRPVGTVTTKRGLGMAHAFFTKYYGTGGVAPVHRPIDTLTAKSRFGLTLVHTMRQLGIVDIGFRMLDVDELARAQGFPDDYELHGNKEDQIRQIGNAVCPNVMEAICRAIGGQ